MCEYCHQHGELAKLAGRTIKRVQYVSDSYQIIFEDLTSVSFGACSCCEGVHIDEIVD